MICISLIYSFSNVWYRHMEGIRQSHLHGKHYGHTCFFYKWIMNPLCIDINSVLWRISIKVGWLRGSVLSLTLVLLWLGVPDRNRSVVSFPVFVLAFSFVFTVQGIIYFCHPLTWVLLALNFLHVCTHFFSYI